MEPKLDRLTREDVMLAMEYPADFLALIEDVGRRNALRRWLWRHGAPVTGLTDVGSERGKGSPPVLIEMAALHAEAGLYGDAIDFVRSALDKDPRAFHHLRFIGLTRALGWLAPELVGQFDSEIALTDQLLRDRGTVTSILANTAKSICIVGNAPNLSGAGRGEEIDSADIVVRFNNFETLGYEEDYGRRTDVWVRAASHSSVARWERPEPVRVAVAGPPVFWRMKNGQYFLADYALSGLPTEVVGPRVYSGAVRQVGHPPSSGLLMLWWMITLRGSLQNVTVIGFDPASQVSGLKHYFPSQPRTTPVPHDWQSEAEVISGWLQRYSAKT